ncbi:ankyrin repeat domain-containing protein [Sansalvadorimonas verongulae]|uniref:ankyrin repeat domain-containing protein n=1 Tax=Sansalvadorimonas verongulae TaxID=2172824 RepID=UPI0018AD2C2F|nr:ankyrin repeat domain-containing protein [Sansalvadorimonas verongulae]
MRVHKKQQWFYISFFFFALGVCAEALAEGECKAVLSKALENAFHEHDFLAACREGNVEAVQSFLDLEEFDVNKPLISGISGKPVLGLFIAMRYGHTEVVDMLLGVEGIEVDNTFQGATPLFQTVQTGHIEVVRALQEAAADPAIERPSWGSSGHTKKVNRYAKSNIERLDTNSKRIKSSPPESHPWIIEMPVLTLHSGTNKET